MNLLTGLSKLLSSPVLGDEGGTFWFPKQASTMAKEIDWLFYFILVICTIFFIIIVAMMAGCVHLYRRKPGVKADTSFTHSTTLELAWSIIPAILLVPMFWWGFTGFVDAYTPPRDCYEVSVQGSKWDWNFAYPNGAQSPKELHIPVGVPIKLTTESSDVIHSIFIPAMRIKRDAVPGRYNYAWFQATQTGTYDLSCAEYCGTGHSTMLGHCVVEEPEAFKQWVKDQADIDKFLKDKTPVEKGRWLYDNKGCAQCHTLDGKKGIGPTFQAVWGRPEQFEDGTSIPGVDDNYVRESLMEPLAKVVKGYQPQMPTQRGKLSDKEIRYLIEFMKTVK